MKNTRRIGKCAYVEEDNVFFNPCNLCDLNKERKKRSLSKYGSYRKVCRFIGNCPLPVGTYFKKLKGGV